MNKTQKHIISYVLSVGMLLSAFPAAQLSAFAAGDAFPDTVFAASMDESVIAATSLSVNGNITANGDLVLTEEANINGTVTDHARRKRMFAFNKLDNRYFQNAETFEDGYTLEGINLNLNTPFTVAGSTGLNGNLNLNTAVKAMKDIVIDGDAQNANNAVLYSKYGDIIINSSTVNYSGLIYAPLGKVVFTGQNVNLNSAIIIAEAVECTDAASANLSYNAQMAKFIGSESEKLSIPDDEWQYMKDENENEFPDFFENPDILDLLEDSDGDHLPDVYEQFYGSDPQLTDTDGDGLDDYYEVVVLVTDPTLIDTDDNGISDYDEDFDNDDLSNGEEYHLGTDAEMRDTDRDTLSDGDELNLYHTNPLLYDTDFDGISDGDEIALNTNPTVITVNTKDSFTKTFTPDDFGYEDAVFAPDVEFTADAKGILTFKMEYRYTDLSFNGLTPGFIANAMSFSTEGEFGSATLKYHIPDEYLNDDDFEPAVYYFNEERKCLEELTDAVLDGNVLSVALEHFSSYAVMNKKAFDKKFADKRGLIKYLPLSDDFFNTRKTDADLVFVLDDSGSMDHNDPYNMRKTATSNFIQSMPETDSIGIISFTGSVAPKKLLPLTLANAEGKNKAYQALNKLANSYTGTDGSWGLHAGIEMLENGNEDNIKCIIFLTDGEDNYFKYSYSKIIESAQDEGITIFTIGLKNYINGDILKRVANETGGKFFEIDNLAELKDCYEEIRELTVDYITDSNEDGISDYYTWKLCSGQLTDGYGNEIFPFGMACDLSESGIDYKSIKTNPELFAAYKKNAEALYQRVQENDDFDGDGVKNGDEVKVFNFQQRYYAGVFSDPGSSDTDDDGFSDFDEINTYQTAPDKFTAIAELKHYNDLTYDDYYIASEYKDQYLKGNILNHLGMAISKLYSRNSKHDIYVKELSNALTSLYASYENPEYQDALFIMTKNDAKNSMAYIRTLYAAHFEENIYNIAAGTFDIRKYSEAQKAFIDVKKAENDLEFCTDFDQIHAWAQEFHRNTDLSKFETMFDFKQALAFDVKNGLKEAFKAPGDKVLRVLDVAMILLGGAIEGYSTASDYENLRICANFFNDSEEILTRIQDRTHNSMLYNVIDEILPAFRDSKEMTRQKIQQSIQNGLEEAIYETIHTVVSWCGSVGAVIEVVIALGSLTGIPETAQHVYETCCSASMADCLAAEWKDDILNRMDVNSKGVRYTNEGSSYYADPSDIINYQRYVRALRLESADRFIDMEEAGILKTFKQWLYKEEVKDAKQSKKDLSYELMKKLHYFIDPRVYLKTA